jgi:hypothetical protein
METVTEIYEDAWYETTYVYDEKYNVLHFIATKIISMSDLENELDYDNEIEGVVYFDGKLRLDFESYQLSYLDEVKQFSVMLEYVIKYATKIGCIYVDNGNGLYGKIAKQNDIK